MAETPGKKSQIHLVRPAVRRSGGSVAVLLIARRGMGARLDHHYPCSLAVPAGCLSHHLHVPFSCAPLRWRILLNTDAHFDVPTVFVATMAGYLGNSFLPARAGEFVRSYIISSRSSLTKTYVLTTALSERMVDAIVLVLASSVVLLGVNPKPSWLGDMSRTTAVIAGAGLLTIAIVPHTGDLVERLLRRIPMPLGLRTRLMDLAAQILLGLRTFHSPTRLAGFGLFTVLIWSVDCVTAILGAHALGIDLPFRVALLLLAGMGSGKCAALDARICGYLSVRYGQHPDPVRRPA